jgi:RHS repeat-associated protein
MYQDYGKPVDPCTLTPAIGSPSIIGNPYYFVGRRYDEETNFYYYRTRYLDPTIGRFTTRDVIGIWGDKVNLGNGYTYVGDNPFSYRDPTGKGPKKISKIPGAVKKFIKTFKELKKLKAILKKTKETVKELKKGLQKAKKAVKEAEKKIDDLEKAIGEIKDSTVIDDAYNELKTAKDKAEQINKDLKEQE